MVLRNVLALDSEALVVAGNSPFLAPGSSIINNSSSPNGTIYNFIGGLGQIITLNDTRQIDVFNDDDPNNHVITDGGTLIQNGVGVESESLIMLRALDSNGNPTGPEITINVYSRDGQFSNIWGFSQTDQLNSGTQYVKVGGSNDGDSDYDNIAPCFVAGTMIRTEFGYVPVEDITIGMPVWTQSDGFQPVRWVESVKVSGYGFNAPIEFEAGVLGNLRPLRVSPNHRMSHASAETELTVGEDQVLISAKSYVGMPGVNVVPCDQVTYVHFLFDGHQIVDAEGALSESFYPGAVALGSLCNDAREEIFALFPELRTYDDTPMELAAPALKDFEARLVLGAKRQRAG